MTETATRLAGRSVTMRNGTRWLVTPDGRWLVHPESIERWWRRPGRHRRPAGRRS